MIRNVDFHKGNILVIGDIMLDSYYDGEVQKISPEAPVPIFQKREERSVLGGAANVAANLIAAGQNVSIMALIGDDETGEKLKNILETNGIDTNLLITLNRHTTEKIRLLANSHQQIIRIDVEDTIAIGEQDCKRLLQMLDDVVHRYEIILMSDYLKGLLTFEFTQGVIEIAKRKNIPVIIDVKDSFAEKYKGAYLLKPNCKELHNLTDMPVTSDEEIIIASKQLKRICNCQYVLTTCGARGMVLIGDEDAYFINAVKKEVFDVTGAGDTVIAYLTACIINDFSIKKAVDIANYAAGIQVSKIGTSSISWEEIKDFIADKSEQLGAKLMEIEAVNDLRRNYINKKIVFTNGCFDIMHVGHVRYLQEAAKLGDILVVGINSDASVKRLKGADRPINSEFERAEMIAVLSFVDYVVIFEEDTPYELIKKIQPDILVKGEDYKPENVVGRDIVEERGGKLVLIPFVEGKSTTNIIRKIKSRHDGFQDV